MSRPRKFDEEAILNAALEVGGEAGFERLSVSRVAGRVGAPSGSVYHRYASRDALMAALWLRTVERFQAGYLEALDGEAPALERARAAALHVVRWSREYRHAATLLLRYRCEDLLDGAMPEAFAKRAATLNEAAVRRVVALAGELWPGSPDVERVRFACVSVPMAAVRESLVAKKSPPKSVERLVDETVVALLQKGTS